jgi:hypothetical protein
MSLSDFDLLVGLIESTEHATTTDSSSAAVVNDGVELKPECVSITGGDVLLEPADATWTLGHLSNLADAIQCQLNQSQVEPPAEILRASMSEFASAIPSSGGTAVALSLPEMSEIMSGSGFESGKKIRYSICNSPY